MIPVIAHIGPLTIQSYGVSIVAGLLLFTWLLLRHPNRAAIITQEQLLNVISLAAIVGIVGGHILYVLAEPELSLWDILLPWRGLAILGSVIGVFAFLLIYLPLAKIPMLPFMDLCAIHAPLLQAFGRIGCFLAGCCYGIPTNLPWAIVYTNPATYAPLCIALHPSQLYSAALLFGVFLLMYFVLQYKFKQPGQLVCWYFILIGLERFVSDFFRAEHQETALVTLGALHFGTWYSGTMSLSLYQLIALAMVSSASIVLLLTITKQRQKN